MKKLILKVILFALVTVNLSVASAQSPILMCSISATSDTSGTLYDSGGLTNDYLVNEDCTLLISPSCATSITLTFQQFDTEDGWDFFYVYDGPTTAAPELLNTSGSVIPPSVTCTSGYMLIIWHSDNIITAPGFAATWTSIIAPSSAPTAAFSIGNTNPPLSAPVSFTDQSTGNPTSWLWDFGNGDTARSQNPVYSYSTPGNYTVTLIAYTCGESDTITHTLTVQSAPQIDVSPAAGFTANVACGDSVSFDLDVTNVAGGQLIFNTEGSLVGDIKVLAMTYGVDPFQEYPRTIAAINSTFTNYTLTSTATTNPGVLSGLLTGKNVLLIPEHESGNDSVWINMGPVIRQYLNNGGSVVFLGQFSSYSSVLFNTGVFTGSYVSNVENLTLSLVNTTDPITTGLTGTTMPGPSATYSMNITNPDKVNLVNYQGNDVVTYRYYGAGKAIYIGFDYFETNTSANRIIGNAIQWAGENALPSWIHINPTSGTANSGQTTTLNVTFVANNIPAGTYYANIGVSSNDPLDPLVIVPCTMTVTGFPILGLSDNCLAIGQIMQHTAKRDTFTVLNTGCDTLFVTSITTATSSFTINANFNYLLPGAFADVIVTFRDSTVGSFVDTVTVLNNDVDTFICLTASTFPAPIAFTSATSIVTGLRACNDSGTNSFYIKNDGGSQLDFTLSSLPQWVTANPTLGSLAPNDSVIVTLTFNSGLMPGGAYNTSVIIQSNDPLSPFKNVPCTLNVDYNPCVDFSFTSNTCTGFSTFTTTSINTPTSYYWDFGDGTVDSVANPSHPYSVNGTYNATLIACNASGCDTVTQAVQAIITGPKAATCYPQTQAYCCGIGITLFQVSDASSYLYNNATNDALVGYEDFTCTDTATLLTNYIYGITVNTGFTYAETVKMWLDLNNDGIFDTQYEQLYLDSNVLTTHIGTFVIPSYPSNVYGSPLRLRIASDFGGSPTPEPCLDLQTGQHEDYSFFLAFNTGVNELAVQNSFKVYPNPFSGSTSIDYTLKQSSEVSVDVYNIIGEKIDGVVSAEKQQPGKYSYEFSGKPAGIYFVRLTVDGKTAVEKIVKM